MTENKSSDAPEFENPFADIFNLILENSADADNLVRVTATIAEQLRLLEGKDE